MWKVDPDLAYKVNDEFAKTDSGRKEFYIGVPIQKLQILYFTRLVRGIIYERNEYSKRKWI